MADSQVILILGGARSGKSAYAEALATRYAAGRAVIFIATATASDAEMAARIAHHRAQRPAHWHTVEAPLDPAADLARSELHAPVIALDCLTLLAANILLQQGSMDRPEASLATASAAETQLTRAVDALITRARGAGATLILISNEVGMGLVPEYPLGRVYRDILGRLNARVARTADATRLLIAGLPIDIKALALPWPDETA
jgi:adenosylcobinamide kinase/adenosylcobinamide-phosphate guanylyltransferase